MHNVWRVVFISAVVVCMGRTAQGFEGFSRLEGFLFGVIVLFLATTDEAGNRMWEIGKEKAEKPIAIPIPIPRRFDGFSIHNLKSGPAQRRSSH